MSEALERVRLILDPILSLLGLFLWDMEFKKDGPRWLLRIYIDRETGVTLDDCEAVSRDLGAALDVEDVITHAYTLEVSSPGLDRRLTRPEHFQRFTGSRAKVKTHKPIGGRKAFIGELAGTAEGIVKLRLEGEEVVEIPVADIARASLEVDF